MTSMATNGGMHQPVKFAGKILVLGFGAVAQCTLPLLLKFVDFSMAQVTIIEMDNRAREKATDLIHKGAKIVNDQLTEENLFATLEKFGLGDGDLLLDLAWEISTISLLTFCRARNILYINASVEVWRPYFDARKTDPREFTLYKRNFDVEELVRTWPNNNGPTAILDHGANPGLVSHFVKLALKQIGEWVIKNKCQDNEKRAKTIDAFIKAKDWPHLAQELGVKVIHISERDTQITDKPKKVNELVNTWSPGGLYEEGVAPAELGWGTHEKSLPSNAIVHDTYGPRNQILLTTRGMNTFVRSWVPNPHSLGGVGYDILGMVIRHGEAYTISKYLTVEDGHGKALYRPTVHYAYCPSDGTIAALHELRMTHYQHMKAEQMRVMKDEIISGEDILGCLLMGGDFTAWWIGSALSIDESRGIVPHQNATTVQVAASMAAAIHWMIKNPRAGVCNPDALPYDEILPLAMPYLGKFISMPVDWDPVRGMRTETTSDYMRRQIPSDEEERWQFNSFLSSAF
jgi:homospermidine synthase